jgi:hypothetical protein
MNGIPLDFDLDDERWINRLHINMKNILINHFTGHSSIMRNGLSDRFDDIHQEFIVCHSNVHPSCIIKNRHEIIDLTS